MLVGGANANDTETSTCGQRAWDVDENGGENRDSNREIMGFVPSRTWLLGFDGSINKNKICKI